EGDVDRARVVGVGGGGGLEGLQDAGPVADRGVAELGAAKRSRQRTVRTQQDLLAHATRRIPLTPHRGGQHDLLPSCPAGGQLIVHRARMEVPLPRRREFWLDLTWWLAPRTVHCVTGEQLHGVRKGR